MQWVAPSGGLFDAGMQGYLWQALWWLMEQAAPLLMILAAASMAGLVFKWIYTVVTAPQQEPYDRYSDDEEDEDE